MKTIYMDHAAATPIDERVLAVMTAYASQKFHNPAAIYLAAKEVSNDIEAARKRIAHWLGARSAEIVFTSGGTEANNLAVHGVMNSFPGANIVVSAVEHASVLIPAKAYLCKETRVKPDGSLDLDDLSNKIDDKTVFVSIMYANNEIGTIQSVAAIAKLIKEIRHKRVLEGNTTPIYFHTDACQAGNYLHLYANTLGVDMMTVNGGKIYGPKRAGALFVRTGVILKPQILGGGQEHGMRSGTEDVMSIIGLAEALTIAQEIRDKETRRLADLQQLFTQLVSQKLPQAKINGAIYKLPNNIHMTLPGHDNERLMMALDEAGIQCAVGSACSASSDEASYVLGAIGLDNSEARASLRFTLGRSTTEADIKQTITALIKLTS